ncbi:MAG: SDR family NAD(P)-dependent oxidoreductase [Planctomycetota bacterium]|jgi:3-oxoacyl-[acyl-carrier protein] reductase
MINTGLKDKVVIVTGANHGIGAGIAVAFAREGAKVFINYYRAAAEAYGEISDDEAKKASEPGRAFYYKMQTQTADNVVQSIQEIGSECFTCEADLSIPETIPAIFDKAEKELGPVDVLVNNAAYGKCDTFIPQDELDKQPSFLGQFPKVPISTETHDAHFAVNSRAVVLMIAEFAKRYVARQAKTARIINISSDGAHGYSEAVSYYASKWAAESFTRAAAMELGPYGITVNTVSPGAVNTGYLPLHLEQEGIKSYPLRRLGKPEDIANAVIFFASKQADWITGQVLFVGGGNRM